LPRDWRGTGTGSGVLKLVVAVRVRLFVRRVRVLLVVAVCLAGRQALQVGRERGEEFVRAAVV
jgi:hypothetical protein